MSFCSIRESLPDGADIEIWWQDEARLGRKNKITRRWARRGTRPRAPDDSVHAVVLFTDNDQTKQKVVAYYGWIRSLCRAPADG